MMSKQLALSSIVSVMAMAAFVLLSSASVNKTPSGQTALGTVRAQAELPALSSLLPSLR